MTVGDFPIPPGYVWSDAWGWHYAGPPDERYTANTVVQFYGDEYPLIEPRLQKLLEIAEAALAEAVVLCGTGSFWRCAYCGEIDMSPDDGSFPPRERLSHERDEQMKMKKVVGGLMLASPVLALFAEKAYLKYRDEVEAYLKSEGME